MILADLPGTLILFDSLGLIEGASENKGLGHQFLQHIERAKVILYVLDGSGEDDRHPVNDYRTLRSEIEAYNPKLLEKPSLIVIISI